MTTDIDSPLNEYNLFYKDEHARTVSDYFEQLVKTSGIDEKEHVETIAALRVVEGEVEKGSRERFWFKTLRVLLILASIGCAAAPLSKKPIFFLLFIPGIAFVTLVWTKLNPRIRELNEGLKELEADRDAKSRLAWSQIEPLNNLHFWGVARTLFQKTLPQFQLDSHFTVDRLTDLRETYGLSDDENVNRSVLFTQSGAIKGNPFAIARILRHWIGSKYYRGSLTITWTEQQRNSQGQWVNVQKSQVLTASVTKPFPEYATNALIIYGHEAAPNLSFSRKPSKLSGLEGGSINDWRFNHKVKSVERQARKATNSGSSNLTIMANKEFEALFSAIDRDDEVEFRLLFTPMAQQEMVNLLNDKSHGPGDVFWFTKMGMVNVIESKHLNEIVFDDTPPLFKAQELAAARRFFNHFHNEYFRALYFGFAPLLTVPLYQEPRTLPGHRETFDDGELAFWEHEVMANYMGEGRFAHPESVTTNILKTSSQSVGNDASIVEVTASGYLGASRLDMIPVGGGDGRMHNVPVHWVEYLPVKKTSRMLMGKIGMPAVPEENQPVQNSWERAVQGYGVDSASAFLRDSLAAVYLSS